MVPSTKTNWLDSAINWVAPQLGLKRIRARAMQETLLSYEGIRSARRLGGWTTTSASGNTEIGAGLRKLRDNARDLCRNNAFAKKAKREWAKRVVGTGITPRANTGSDALDKRIMDIWGEFVEQCCSDQRINFYAAQKMIVSSCYETGEVLVRLWDRSADDELPVPFQIQMLEADYLDTDKTMATDAGYILHGVEFDRIGRIRGYWLFGNHPGEILQNSRRGSYTSKFIPAQYVLHHAEFDRPGDVRAVSRLSAVMAKLRDIDEYADATIVRQKLAACAVGMITQPEGGDGPTMGPTALDADGKKVEEFRTGQFIYGSPGANIEFFNPPGSGDFSAYKKTELREIAVGLDIPYVVLDDNLEAVNYSSYRGGLIAFRDAIEEYRWNWLIPQVLNPVWRRFIDKLVFTNKIPARNYSVEWDPPQFDLLDRAAEAEADRLECQIGSSTWDQLVARRGYNPNEQIKEIGNRYKELISVGVSFAKNPTDSGGQANDANPEPASV